MQIDEFIEQYVVEPKHAIVEELRVVDQLLARVIDDVDYESLLRKLGGPVSINTWLGAIDWIHQNHQRGSFETILQALPRFDRYGHKLSDENYVQTETDINTPITTQTKPNPPRSQLLRSLRLFEFILDKETRERVFQPSFEDLKLQHIESRRFRTKWAKRWIRFAFGFRTVVLIAECFRVMLLDRILRPFSKLVPNEIKRWWYS